MIKDIDLILFCTKNPIPIIKYLKSINKPMIFHITLTPYNKDIEPNVPNKKVLQIHYESGKISYNKICKNVYPECFIEFFVVIIRQYFLYNLWQTTFL